MRLRGKVAVITGGGGGLGRGIGLCLAEEGADVVVGDLDLVPAREAADAIRRRGVRSLAVRTDVTEDRQCRELMAACLDTMGRFDILVCAAGVGGFVYWDAREDLLLLENLSEEEWDLTLRVNLTGVFLSNRAALPHLKKAGRGRIVNLSSAAGRQGMEWIPHYSAAKAGVINFGQSLAQQVARQNITVNTICPGFVWSPMWEKGAGVMSRTVEAFKGLEPKEIFETIVRESVSTGRPQTAGDIGAAVVFLASDQAGEITGQALNVDGGYRFN